MGLRDERTDEPIDAPWDDPTDAPTDAPDDGPADAPADQPVDAPTRPRRRRPHPLAVLGALVGATVIVLAAVLAPERTAGFARCVEQAGFEARSSADHDHRTVSVVPVDLSTRPRSATVSFYDDPRAAANRVTTDPAVRRAAQRAVGVTFPPDELVAPGTVLTVSSTATSDVATTARRCAVEHPGGT